MNVKTRCNKREGFRMKHEMMKEISWQINQEKFIICNVPCNVYKEYSNEEVYDSDVTLKLLLLKDLMEANEIPPIIDFQESNDIAFD